MDISVSAAIKDWIPYRLSENNSMTTCEWLYLGDTVFDRPFFDETISQCKSLAENSKLKKSLSSIDMLEEWAGAIESISPNAIIFHVSRCGSTLLSQLLATDSSNIVLSEVPFFDDILKLGFRKENIKSIFSLFQAGVKLYGAKRRPNQQRLFIKADSWHIHFYKELREMYPQLPFLFLYRTPGEVIRSHQKQRGMHAVPGIINPSIFGFEKEIAQSTNLDEYTSKVLETYYSSITEILKKDAFAFAFDYKEGIINITQSMLLKCNISLSEEQRTAMKERSTTHSKFPEQVFTERVLTSTPPGYMHRAFQLYNALDSFSRSH